jgi:hypothetical protein
LREKASEKAQATDTEKRRRKETQVARTRTRRRRRGLKPDAGYGACGRRTERTPLRVCRKGWLGMACKLKQSNVFCTHACCRAPHVEDILKDAHQYRTLMIHDVDWVLVFVCTMCRCLHQVMQAVVGANLSHAMCPASINVTIISHVMHRI